MKSLRTLTRFMAPVVLATMLLPACHSSGNDNTTSSGPLASFAPDPSLSGARVSLLSGASSGASVDVRVAVTGVPSFFGAAFRITYNTTALLFNGMATTSSFLRTNLTDPSKVFFLEDHTTTPGEIVVTATRIAPESAVDATTTSDVIVLNFTARQEIVAATAEGRLDFADPKQVCDGTVAAPGCGSVSVVWYGGGITAQ